MEKHEKQTVANVISSWLIKYRVVLLSIICLLVVAAIVIGVVFAINENTRNKGFSELDSYSLEHTKLLEDSSLASDELLLKESDILAKIVKLATSNKNNAVGSRAYMLAAEITFKNEDYANAKDYWIAGANANKKAYTAPLCWYNAAIAAEELGLIDEAIANMDLAISQEEFSLKSRALFNAGRLEELRNNYEAAATRYNELNALFAGDSWANLGKSRLITLESEGKIE